MSWNLSNVFRSTFGVQSTDLERAQKIYEDVARTRGLWLQKDAIEVFEDVFCEVGTDRSN